MFDFCQNLEFFSQDAPAVEGASSDSLSARLFRTRLELINALDQRLATDDAEPDRVLRADVAGLLHAEVAAMNVNNFLVRPRRRLVEQFAQAAAWTTLNEEARAQLADQLAGLPCERPPEGLEAKQFDLLMLTLQLCVLGAADGYARLRLRVIEIASALEEQANIPVIAAQMPLIQDVQTDEWWQDVTVSLLDNARKRLRGLIHLIEVRRRVPIYTDFVDEIGEGEEIAFAAFAPPNEFEKFRAKARHFLRAHLDHVAVHKLRHDRQLTPTDLAELERMLSESGLGSPDDLIRAKSEDLGLGLFVRSLIGLDRAAAKQAFAGFLDGQKLTGNQIHFIDMIVDHLTENGVMDAARLYESPYTDVNPLGVDGVFASAEVDTLVAVLEGVSQRAAA